MIHDEYNNIVISQDHVYFDDLIEKNDYTLKSDDEFTTYAIVYLIRKSDAEATFMIKYTKAGNIFEKRPLGEDSFITYTKDEINDSVELYEINDGNNNNSSYTSGMTGTISSGSNTDPGMVGGRRRRRAKRTRRFRRH